FNRLGPIVQAIDPKQVNTFLDTIVQALDGNQDKIRSAIDNLAVVAQSLGSRDQAIGRLIENLNTVTGAIDDRDAQIRTVLDNLVALNQTIPCGAIGNPPLVVSNDPCITGAGSAGLSQAQSSHAQGAAAIAQLLGQGLS